MCSTPQETYGASKGFGTGRGLATALLIAVPLWVLLGILLLLVFQPGPVGESSSAAAMIAAVCLAILFRPYVRALYVEIRNRVDLERAKSVRGGNAREAQAVQLAFGGRNSRRDNRGKTAERPIESIEDLLRYIEPKRASSFRTRREVAPFVILRQSLFLSALVGAYLQYYFLEVHLQIASLRSITVFVPVS